MVVFNERSDLAIDSGTIKPHHEELTHLPVRSQRTPWSATAFSRHNQVHRVQGGEVYLAIGHKMGGQIAKGVAATWRQDKRPAHLSRLSQTGGSGSSFGAMVALSEECQLSPMTP